MLGDGAQSKLPRLVNKSFLSRPIPAELFYIQGSLIIIGPTRFGFAWKCWALFFADKKMVTILCLAFREASLLIRTTAPQSLSNKQVHSY